MPNRGSTDQDARVLLRRAIVSQVDSDAFTLTAQFIYNEAPTEDVAIGGGYVSLRGGGWMGAMPEPGDQVLLAKPQFSEEWVVLGYAPYPDRETVDGTEDAEELGARNRFRGGRPRVQPGEMVLAGPSGGHVIIRRDGNIEIEADPMCTMAFFSDTQTIKQVCQNLILEGFWGALRYWTLRDDARDEADATPTGMDLQLKSLAQHAPHIFFHAGAILEEENLPMPGYPPLSKNRFGSGACVRFMIFEQNFAQNQADAGLNPPDPRQARLVVRMSPSGDISIISKGHIFTEARDRTSAVYGRDIVVADTIEYRTTKGRFDMISDGRMELSSKRKMSFFASGDMSVRSKNYKLTASRGEFQFSGGVRFSCEGNWRLVGGGHGIMSFDGGLSLSTGESMSQRVGGRYSLNISGSETAENLGRDVISHKVTVKNGKSQTNVEAGGLELNVGPLGTGLSYLRMHNDPVRLFPFVGRVELGTLAGARIILDPTGGWQIAGVGGVSGSIHADASGRIQIGPVGSPGGYVVTTTSHRCWVTGLPPLGNPLVSVTQLSPGVPIPAVPVVPPVPTPILPEDVAFV